MKLIAWRPAPGAHASGVGVEALGERFHVHDEGVAIGVPGHLREGAWGVDRSAQLAPGVADDGGRYPRILYMQPSPVFCDASGHLEGGFADAARGRHHRDPQGDGADGRAMRRRLGQKEEEPAM